MKEFPALIKLLKSGYELVVYSLEDVPQGVEFKVLGRNYKCRRP